jgi:hypothetical protein
LLLPPSVRLSRSLPIANGRLLPALESRLLLSTALNWAHVRPPFAHTHTSAHIPLPAPGLAPRLPPMAAAGLLSGPVDLRVLSLALLSDPPCAPSAHLRRSVALQAIRDDSRAFSALTALYHSSPASPRACAPPPPALRGHTPGAARAARDLAAGRPALVVPHLRVPWAAALAAALWRNLGVRLDRRAPHRPPTDLPRTLAALAAEADAGFDAAARAFYPPLPPDDQEYNDVVLAHLQRSHGPDTVAKLANLVRLSYVNSLLADVRRQFVAASAVRDALRASIPCSSTYSKQLVRSPPRRARVRARSAQRPRVNLTATPVASADKYIVHGSLVPAKLLPGVCSVLAREFHVHVSAPGLDLSAAVAPALQREKPVPPIIVVGGTGNRRALSLRSMPSPPKVVAAPSAASVASSTTTNPATSLSFLPSLSASALPSPTPALVSRCHRRSCSDSHTRELTSYLSECFGETWLSVCAYAVSSARAEHTAIEIAALDETLLAVGRVEDAAQRVRKTLVDAAVAYEVADAPLSRKCALAIAQSMSASEINALYTSIPREMWRLIAAARDRLEDLENAESISLQSLAPL